MKYVLSVINRLTMYSILPFLNSDSTRDDLIKLFSDVVLSEVEMAGYPGTPDVTIEIGEELDKLIIDVLTVLFKTGKMSDDQIELYKVFVEK
jgi:hypothetical protein